MSAISFVAFSWVKTTKTASVDQCPQAKFSFVFILIITIIYTIKIELKTDLSRHAPENAYFLKDAVGSDNRAVM